MKLIRRAPAVILAAGLSVWSAHPAGAAPPHVLVEDDRFSSRITLSGPEVLINPFGGVTRDWHLRSWVNKKVQAITDQLYVDISYVGASWSFYAMAADEDANDLQVTRIDSNVDTCRGGCDFNETLGVAIDHAALVAHADKGYSIKLTAKDGSSLILTVTPEQIALQLAAEQRQIAILNGAPVPPDPYAPADLDSTVPIPPGTQAATIPITVSPSQALDAATHVLAQEGYTVVPTTPPSDSLTTAPLHKRVSMREADCGRKWGIPYLMDGRTKTDVSMTVSVQGGQMKIASGIIGVMKVGMGAPDTALTCTSKGVLETDTAKAIAAALAQSAARNITSKSSS